MAGAHAGAGIKLFGATITLQDQQDKTHRPIRKITNSNNDIHDEEQESQREELKRPERVIACPRCKSMETKFCYFNNYNVNQPRHFCKGCQRYWTAGGALRNVPVGAGRRKVKPPCREMLEGGCLYGDVAVVQGFDLWDGGLVEDWSVAAVHGGFQRVFPVKRRRVDDSDEEIRSRC